MMRTPSIHHHKSYEDIPLPRGWVILGAALASWSVFHALAFGLVWLIARAGGGA